MLDSALYLAQGPAWLGSGFPFAAHRAHNAGTFGRIRFRCGVGRCGRYRLRLRARLCLRRCGRRKRHALHGAYNARLPSRRRALPRLRRYSGCLRNRACSRLPHQDRRGSTRNPVRFRISRNRRLRRHCRHWDSCYRRLHRRYTLWSWLSLLLSRRSGRRHRRIRRIGSRKIGLRFNCVCCLKR